jgi:hypothetical protein
VNITVYRPGDLTAADRAVWSRVQAKAAASGSPQLGNPFLAPEFALAVGRHRRGVRIRMP